VEETTLLFRVKPDRLQGRTRPLAPIVDDQLQATSTADTLSFQCLEELDPFFGTFTFSEAPKQDLATVPFRPNAHSNHDRHFEPPFDRPPAPSTVTADLAVGAQEGDPDGIHLKDRRHIFCLSVRIEGQEQMQPLIQGAQGQWADMEVSEPFAHLSQAHGYASQALDLNVHVIADALIWPNQPTKIDFHTTPALASHTRYPKGYFAPDQQQRLPRTKAIPTEASALSGSATAAFTFSAQSRRHFHAPNVMATVHRVAHNGHEQCGKSCTYCLTQALHRFVQLCFKKESGIDRRTSFGYPCHGAASL
jgi:hypothetical protein